MLIKNMFFTTEDTEDTEDTEKDNNQLYEKIGSYTEMLSVWLSLYEVFASLCVLCGKSL